MKINKTILTILATIILTVSITTLINAQSKPVTTLQESKQTVSIISTFTESRSDFHLEGGDAAIELSDGSYAIYNESTGLYTFTPIVLGDYEYTLNNKTELDNIITTYINIANTGTY